MQNFGVEEGAHGECRAVWIGERRLVENCVEMGSRRVQNWLDSEELASAELGGVNTWPYCYQHVLHLQSPDVNIHSTSNQPLVTCTPLPLCCCQH